MVFESNVTIKKDDLEKWISEQMTVYLSNLCNKKNHKYNRLEGLIIFGILNQLRRDAGLDHQSMLPELYKRVNDLNAEARHYFQIDTGDINPFEKIDELIYGKKDSMT